MDLSPPNARKRRKYGMNNNQEPIRSTRMCAVFGLGLPGSAVRIFLRFPFYTPLRLFRNYEPGFSRCLLAGGAVSLPAEDVRRPR
jgi:hypothetical protein